MPTLALVHPSQLCGICHNLVGLGSLAVFEAVHPGRLQLESLLFLGLSRLDS